MSPLGASLAARLARATNRAHCSGMDYVMSLSGLWGPGVAFVVRGTTIVHLRRFRDVGDEAKKGVDQTRSLIATLGGFSLAGLALLGDPSTSGTRSAVAVELMTGFSAYLVAFLLLGIAITELGWQLANAAAHAGHMSLALFGWRYGGLADTTLAHRIPGGICLGVAGLTTIVTTCYEHRRFWAQPRQRRHKLPGDGPHSHGGDCCEGTSKQDQPG